MNKDDILKLARGAGYETSRWDSTEQFEEFLESFANFMYTYVIITHLQDEVGQAIAREREACAKVCEEQIKVYLSPKYSAGQPFSSYKERFAAAGCAEAIRSRGNT